MKFNNRVNWYIERDGNIEWISRSVTVLAILLFVVTDERGDRYFVPLGKRGDGLPDERGKWALPGGYLDWDETVGEALLREVYEELGLNLLDLQANSRQFKGNLEQPYFVYSVPQRLQNVTLWFPLMFWVQQLPPLAPQVPLDEVAETQWLELAPTVAQDLAFGHQNIIRHCLQHYYQWPESEIP